MDCFVALTMKKQQTTYNDGITNRIARPLSLPSLRALTFTVIARLACKQAEAIHKN